MLFIPIKEKSLPNSLAPQNVDDCPEICSCHNHHNGNKRSESLKVGRRVKGLSGEARVLLFHDLALMQSREEWEKFLVPYSTNDKKILQKTRRLQQNMYSSLKTRKTRNLKLSNAANETINGPPEDHRLQALLFPIQGPLPWESVILSLTVTPESVFADLVPCPVFEPWESVILSDSEYGFPTVTPESVFDDFEFDLVPCELET